MLVKMAESYVGGVVCPGVMVEGVLATGDALPLLLNSWLLRTTDTLNTGIKSVK